MYIIIGFVIGLVIGSVGVWLVMRNNPKLNAQAESIAQKVEDKI